METIRFCFAWRGVVRAGFDVFRLREVTAGALDGDWSRRLPADVEREAAWRFEGSLRADWRTEGELRLWRDGPGPLALDVRVTPGGASSPSLAKMKDLDCELLGRVESLLDEAVARKLRFSLLSGWLRSTGESPWLRVEADQRQRERARGGDWSWLTHEWFPAPVRVELHYPFLDRSTAKEWDEGGWQGSPSLDERGRILLGDPDLYQGEILMGGPLRKRLEGGSASFELAFSDVKCLPWAVARETLAPLMTACGFPPPAGAPQGQVEAAWSYAISGEAAEAWLTVHPERSEAASSCIKKMSSALQRVLRLWLPYHYFERLDNYRDPSFAWPMLVYSAMPIFENRNKHEYAYEMLAPRKILAGFRYANPSLKEKVRSALAILELAGQMELRRKYALPGSKGLLRDMERLPKYFGTLLTLEGFLVKELKKFWLAGQEFAKALDSSAAVTPKNVRRKARDYTGEIEWKLRRMYGAFSFRPLASLVWVAATWALAKAQGRPFPLEVVLRLKDMATGREIFYANHILPERNSRSRELIQYEHPDEVGDSGTGGRAGRNGHESARPQGKSRPRRGGRGVGKGDPREVFALEDRRGEVSGSGARRGGDDRRQDRRDPEKGHRHPAGETGGSQFGGQPD